MNQALRGRFYTCKHGDIAEYCRACKAEIEPEVKSLPELLNLAVLLAKTTRRSNQRQAVYNCIDSEREYQDKRWPLPKHVHEVESFLVYMEHYINKLKTLRSTSDQFEQATLVETQDILRKIIALGVACAEIHGIRPREIPPAGSLVEQLNAHRDDAGTSTPPGDPDKNP